MPASTRIGLDNPAFSGRLRGSFSGGQVLNEVGRRPSFDTQVGRPGRPGVAPPKRNLEVPLPLVAAQPFAEPARPKQQQSRVLHRQTVYQPEQNRKGNAHHQRFRQSRLQWALAGLAGLIAVCGLAVTWQTAQTNHAAAAQVAALSKQVDKQSSSQTNSSLPSTVKPSSQAVNNYAVAPDLPRYLNIPTLGVHARVMQVGVDSAGALGTPSNVYDTAWYTGSAKPGQPGATLIDGHVSSWTTRGVFYGLKTLVAGDMLQIVRGDGQVFNYQVVKTQAYPADAVDMQAAVTPVTPGKSGLNLITCTGQVLTGTSRFKQRLIVFAQQV